MLAFKRYELTASRTASAGVDFATGGFTGGLAGGQPVTRAGVQVKVASAAIFRAVFYYGASSDDGSAVCDFNGGSALVAGALYHFAHAVFVDRKWNYRFASATDVQHFYVEEITAVVG